MKTLKEQLTQYELDIKLLSYKYNKSIQLFNSIFNLEHDTRIKDLSREAMIGDEK